MYLKDTKLSYKTVVHTKKVGKNYTCYIYLERTVSTKFHSNLSVGSITAYRHMKVQSNTAHNCSCTAANHMQDWLED
jgi:hypothetical protein